MTQTIDPVYARPVFQTAPTPATVVRAYADVFRNVGSGALPLAYAFTDRVARRFGDYHVLAHWENSDIWFTVFHRNVALYGAVLNPEHGTCHVVHDANLKVALRWPHGKGLLVQSGTLASSAITRGRNLARALALALAEARLGAETKGRVS